MSDVSRFVAKDATEIDSPGKSGYDIYPFSPRSAFDIILDLSQAVVGCIAFRAFVESRSQTVDQLASQGH